MSNNTKPILIIGGGISGMTSAIEIAEVGWLKNSEISCKSSLRDNALAEWRQLAN